MIHPQQPSYESSSDLGIESGTEVEDSLSEKWAHARGFISSTSQRWAAWIMDFYKKQRNTELTETKNDNLELIPHGVFEFVFKYIMNQ